jgi:hypothetical protein
MSILNEIFTFPQSFLSSKIFHSGIKFSIPSLLLCFLETGCMVGSKSTSIKLLFATVTDFFGVVRLCCLSRLWHVTAFTHSSRNTIEVIEIQEFETVVEEEAI